MYLRSERYTQALRGSSVQWVTVDAVRNGTTIASSLEVTGGSITDDSSPGVRRTMNLQIAPEPGLFDLLAPTGTQLVARSTLRYPDGSTETVPMGVFDIDVQKRGYAPNGDISFTAVDKWARIQKARFIYPQVSMAGQYVTLQIQELIRGALGAATTVVVNSASQSIVGSAVWDIDRDKAITDLADSIGAYAYFDRNGVATVDDLPTLGRSSDWLVDASAAGIMLSADRERNRQRTYNVVKVSSSNADGSEPFQPQVVWDSDPNSPTYAGPNPVSNPAAAGPFGVVPYFYETPLIQNFGAANRTAQTILYRVTGLAAQLSLSAINNPALDSLDIVDVLLPQERADVPRVVERHIVDRVTHPLTVDGTQEITTRSTRTDAYS